MRPNPMNDDKPDFNKVLEEYVLRMASIVINSADESEQASLIQLVTSIEAPLASAERAANPSDWLSGQLEEEWQQALDESPLQSTHQQGWHMGQLTQWLHSQKAYIIHLQKVIASLGQLQQRAQDVPIREPYRTTLLAHQQRTVKLYDQQLTRAQASYQAMERRLSHQPSR